MRLTKRQALDLVKVLSHYQTLDTQHAITNVWGLCGELEEFVLGEEETSDEDEEGDDEDEEAEEDADEDKSVDEEEDEEEPSEQEDDEGDEADDEGDEADEGSNCCPECDGDADGGALHDLSPIRAKVIESSSGEKGEVVQLEFELDPKPGTVDLMIGGLYVGPLLCVKRTGTELHVLDSSDDWHQFSVAKFPKEWQKALPAGDRLRLVSR